LNLNPHLNLGILAHVDAGKTSLTERLLFAAGVIDKVGSVDDGSTQTDSLTLERQRGITIKSAVVSFVIGDVTVNLIDTPGHPDFIAEVERVLSVLDGAVLVISAVEGVQAQTRVLMRTLQRLSIPTLIFVNKIDRRGAQYERLMESISEKLTQATIPMGWASGLGTRSACYTAYDSSHTAFTSRLVDLLADHDDAFMAAYVDDETPVSYSQLRGELAEQSKQGLIHPLFFGSALTGAGIDSLITCITEFLPAAEGDVEGPVSGSVFKVERAPAGEKIAYVRMFSGTIRTRDQLSFGHDKEGKVTAISVFERGSAIGRASVAVGQIGKLWGLGDVRIGDTLGVSRTASERLHFAPPTLETVVVPHRPADKGALHVALAQLTEQDPLINVRQNDVRQELFVSLYGEVQKEVIQATLENDYGLEVTFNETTTICIERPVGMGAAVETLGEPANPFLATVGLRVEPAPMGTGVELRLEVDVGSIPLFIFKAVEEFRRALEDTVQKTLRYGLYGWGVTDCAVTLTRSGYVSPSSTAGDFRKLTPLVLMSALKQAGTVVCEPLNRFHLEVPTDTFGHVLASLARLRAVPQTPSVHGSSYVLEGEIPAAKVNELQQQLPGMTHGEGVLECTFSRYEPVRGEPPTRPRSDYNPLNRKEYLMHVMGWSSAKGKRVS
jgi:ribosomal protection tetracycline resistance protein